MSTGTEGGPADSSSAGRPGADPWPESISGQARALTTRTEPDRSSSASPWTVWTFRVERYDSSGNRLTPVPVQMRGRTFMGGLTEGDWVELRGGRRVDGTLHVRRFQNLTTGATVRARGYPPWVWPLFVIIVIVVLAFVAWIVYSAVTTY